MKTLAMLGSSLTLDRSANNWPLLLLSELRAAKSETIAMGLFGHEGQSSINWKDHGYVQACANMQPDVLIIDGTADANVGFNITTTQALNNWLLIIDTVRFKRPDCKIFMTTMNHMLPAATQFANVTDYYAKYNDVLVVRSNAAIIDCYSAWGDPTLNPSEYGSDPIHPLLAGNLRVTIPVTYASIAPLIS